MLGTSWILIFLIICSYVRAKCSLFRTRRFRWFFITYFPWARDLKNMGKYGSGLSCRWVLFKTWAFGFKRHLIFLRVEFKKTGLIFYLSDFHGRNWRIPGFSENKTQHWALFFTKPNQGRFYFHWPNSLSRAEDLAAVNQVTHAVVRVGSKIGS